jgi:LysM repeat protein
VVVLVLGVAAAAGWGLALFVARVASVEPPAVTISPQPPATASPSAPPSSPSPSAASPSASVQPTASAVPSQAIHVVQPGEFLSQIAARYGVTVEAIVEANGIENPNLIEVGQRLIIPPKP